MPLNASFMQDGGFLEMSLETVGTGKTGCFSSGLTDEWRDAMHLSRGCSRKLEVNIYRSQLREILPLREGETRERWGFVGL